jgi:L-alanine-DL-glutamate epimerase-like enolase superfamily enzyme
MKTTIWSASVEFFEQPFLKPLQISSGKITRITEARVTVRAETDGRMAIGRGSIYLSDLWAWPKGSLNREEKDAAMRRLCEDLARDLPSCCGGEAAHPLELGMRLHHTLEHLEGDIPILARAVCGSPFDAAIHDAAGQASGRSAFDFYSDPEPIPSLDGMFPNGGAAAAIKNMLRAPQKELDAWWLVSASDDLENDVRPGVLARGIRCLKLKILARDAETDARRTAEVYRAAVSWGITPELSVDSNEGHSDAQAVLEYLERLEAIDAEAYAALGYLEQPTARDIEACPQDWRVVTSRKPVLLDEGLTSLDLLPLAVEQGWSGLALKTCKGHSFALAAAAWAHERKLTIALQDLTNPGFSAIHAFLFAAYVPTINGVELNSPQFTPAANAPWLPDLEQLFAPQDGKHRLPELNVPGLGSI